MSKLFSILLTVAVFLLPLRCSSQVNDGENTMTTNTDHEYTNKLIDESSPYLRQHAHNPVVWYPWGEEALEKAKLEDKPIFLSIGYSACHWCHVMEKESFENVAIAQLLNEHFISIKVDREQRPDLDQIYMTATQAMTGSGGWPMSVFLTPDLKPFYAGTYFPPEDKYGRPGFGKIVTELARAYREDRAKINEVSDRLVQALQDTFTGVDSSVQLDIATVEQAANGLMRGYDRSNGGFGGAPKFPHPTDLSFLLKYAVINGKTEILEAVKNSLTKMAHGGIYDQLGGGFHRYATDAKWLVPHFEKMLYDNAMLAVVYSEAYQATGDTLYLSTVTETLDFVIREMSGKEGGYYSSLDADSEGEEGLFYIWKKADLDQLLGNQAEIFNNYYNVSPGGNFEHNTNILNLDQSSFKYLESLDIDNDKLSSSLSDSRKLLLKKRGERIRPFTDDKILTSWNGLMISGMSWGYKISRDKKYLESAINSAQFIKDNLYKDGQLIHSYRDGKISKGQFLEDYAFLIRGLIDLYEVSFDYGWIEFAKELAATSKTLFSDETGNLYLSPGGLDEHVIRPKDIGDGAIPAPGSILIQSVLMLSDITGQKELQDMGEEYLSGLSGNLERAPHSMISAVTALYYLLSERTQLVVIGSELEDQNKFINLIYGEYIPNSVLIVSEKANESIPLLDGKHVKGKTLAYLCRNFSCRLPSENAEMLAKELR